MTKTCVQLALFPTSFFGNFHKEGICGISELLLLKVPRILKCFLTKKKLQSFFGGGAGQ